jgi:hypothetical protein
MGRENQGLNIALIIFFMLSIVLGVTTFLFFRRYDEEQIKARAAVENAAAESTKAANRQEENARLKQMMGFGAAEEMQTVDTQFTKDMQDYAGTFPDTERYYRPLVKQLFDTINARNAELAAVQAELRQLDVRFAGREAGKDGQVQTLTTAAKSAGDELVAEQLKHKQERARIAASQAEVAAALDKSRKDAQDAVAKVEEKLKEAGRRLQQTGTILQVKTQQLEEMTKETVEIPDGEIRWVNQRTGTVWINLGQSDNLNRQTSFSVYSGDTNDLSTGKKASIEVTQILGDHLAEARIVDDQISNPIMPGDKVFTPVWTAGEKRHFAITGVIDLDSDGRSDIDLVRNLIEMNGGVVDAWTDPKGEKHGDLSVQTRFLVLGDAPDTKGAAAMLPAFSRMIGDAERLGVQKVSLPDLLQRMGWKNQTPVVRYGLDANPNDFRAKPPEGVPRVSTGNTTDAFQPRNPPRAGARGAY